jgi:uncharacterized protein YfiM (DUF2279 family)
MNDVTTRQIGELREEIRLRERGRAVLVNCLVAIAEHSTSHADAVRMARDQLSAAGVYYRHNPNLSDEEKAAMPSYFKFEPPVGGD